MKLDHRDPEKTQKSGQIMMAQNYNADGSQRPWRL